MRILLHYKEGKKTEKLFVSFNPVILVTKTGQGRRLKVLFGIITLFPLLAVLHTSSTQTERE